MCGSHSIYSYALVFITYWVGSKIAQTFPRCESHCTLERVRACARGHRRRLGAAPRCRPGIAGSFNMAPKPPGLKALGGGAASQPSERGAPSKRSTTPRGGKGGASPKNSARGTATGKTTPRTKAKALPKAVALTAKGAAAETDRPTGAKGTTKANPFAAPVTGKSGAASERPGATEPPPTGGSAATANTKTALGPNAKKIEYLSDELLARKPLDEKSREALAKKAGTAKQEVHFERNENHRPPGRPDELTPSRHEKCVACPDGALHAQPFIHPAPCGAIL